MKKFIAALGLVVIGGLSSINAQECPPEVSENFGDDSLECRQGVSYYSEFLRQKNWKEASVSWWNAQKICPQYKVNMYVNGVQIYKKIIKDLKKADAKDPNIVIMSDTIDMIYGLWAENFGDCYSIQMDRADNLMRYRANTKYELVNELYRKAFPFADKTEISRFSAKFFYKSSSYMVSNKKATCEMMLTDYELMDGICQANLKAGQEGNDQKKVENWIKVQEYVESYLAPCATPEVLIEMAKKAIAEDPTNIELKKTWVAKLSAKKATDFPEFIEWVVAIDKAEPSAQSKLDLGNNFYNEGDFTKAFEYYDAAIAYPEVTEEQKVIILKKRISYTEKKKSYKKLFALGAQLGGCEGKYVQARAVAISVKSCEKTLGDRAALYTYALKLANEAGSCAKDASIKYYTSSLPSKGDMFKQGISEGDVLPVPCWNTSIAIKLK